MNIQIWVLVLRQFFISIPSENVGKPDVSWRFQGVYKWMIGVKCLNPFAPNAPFSLPSENIKSYGFRMFSGGKERVHREQMIQ